MKCVHCSVLVDPLEEETFHTRDRIQPQREVHQDGAKSKAVPLLCLHPPPLLANFPKTVHKDICYGVWDMAGVLWNMI